METRTEFGYFAQDLAVQWLKERNYEILDQNFRRPWGEVDVICQKDDVIVFIEVKANKREYPGFEPELRVNHDKIERIIRTARTYLAYKKLPDNQEWRIDVLSVTLVKEREIAKIRHYKNIDT